MTRTVTFDNIYLSEPSSRGVLTVFTREDDKLRIELP
jgi:hypothetical protein